MLSEETRQAMAIWLRQATAPGQQLDQRWLNRYRELASYDSYWWLNWSGPFTQEEQIQWDHLYASPMDKAAKVQGAALMKVACERELILASAEQREPNLYYPALNINEVCSRIAHLEELNTEIKHAEPNEVVRLLYQGAIEDEVHYLRMIEATFEGDAERYRAYNQRLYHMPTSDEMEYAFAWVRHLIRQGLKQADTAEIGEHLLHFFQERLQVSLDLSQDKDTPPVVHPQNPSELARTLSAEVVKRFYETALRESGYDGWHVLIDPAGGGTRVEPALRQVLLSGESFTLERVRHLLAHELAGHVARAFAGEHSPIGLLSIGTQGYRVTEEGLALYYEREAMIRHGSLFSNVGPVSGTLAVGLASGAVTAPLPFSSLYTFFHLLLLLYRRLLRPWQDIQTEEKSVRNLALARCLRTYRGVSDLSRKGVCHLQDGLYLRGLLQIERAVASNKHVLDRLAIGKIAYEVLPLLQPLQLVPPPQPLLQLAYDPALDHHILSFETAERTL